MKKSFLQYSRDLILCLGDVFIPFKQNTILIFFQDDFADNREFIALLVYDTGGKKVFYPCM